MGGHYTIGQNQSPYLGGARKWVDTIQLVRITLPWGSGGMGGHYTIGQNQPPYLGGAWEYNWSESVTLPWYTGVVGTELLYYKIRSDKTACGTWMELDQCPYPVQGIPLNLITVKNAIMMWFFSVYKTWCKRCTYLFFILSEEKLFFITFMSNK